MSAGWTTWPPTGCGWSTASQERRRARCSTGSASVSAWTRPNSPATTAGPPATCRWRRPSSAVSRTRACRVEPAALAYGLDFLPLAAERFDLLLPAKHAASREVQGLLKVLTSPWLLAQLASLPGYDADRCGERPS